MATHEWVLTPAGNIIKTDCGGHDCDHTIIGTQSVLWDIAGAVTEWQMKPGERANFIAALERNGIPVDQDALAFHEMAYCAFRVGVCTLFQASAPAERARLQNGIETYKSRLKHLVQGNSLNLAA